MGVKRLGLGLKQWLLVRISAIFIAAYIATVLDFWVRYPQAASIDWASFLHYDSMRVLGVFAGVAVMLHACIGIWVVSTDYIKPRYMRQLCLGFLYLVIVLSSLASILIICCF